MLNWHTVWLQEAGRARPVLFGNSYVLYPPGSSASNQEQQAQTQPPPANNKPGLVPWRRPGGLSQRPPLGLSVRPPLAAGDLMHLDPFGEAAMVVVPAGERGIVPFGGDPVVLKGDGYIEAEAVDAEVLPPSFGDDLSSLPASTTALVMRPQPAAAGIIPTGQPSEDDIRADKAEEGVYESFSSSPRRAHKIKFTCKRCGATSIRPINIHAWREVRG